MKGKMNRLPGLIYFLVFIMYKRTLQQHLSKNYTISSWMMLSYCPSFFMDLLQPRRVSRGVETDFNLRGGVGVVVLAS